MQSFTAQLPRRLFVAMPDRDRKLTILHAKNASKCWHNNGVVNTAIDSQRSENFLENKYLKKYVEFATIPSFSHSMLLHYKRTGGRNFELNRHRERTIYCWVFPSVKPLNLEISRCHFADCVKEMCSTIIFPHSSWTVPHSVQLLLLIS